MAVVNYKTLIGVKLNGFYLSTKGALKFEDAELYEPHVVNTGPVTNIGYTKNTENYLKKITIPLARTVENEEALNNQLEIQRLGDTGILELVYDGNVDNEFYDGISWNGARSVNSYEPSYEVVISVMKSNTVV